MTKQSDRSDSGSGLRATRKRRPSLRALALAMLAVVGVIALTVGWLGFRGLAAKRHLEAARAGIEVARAAALDGRSTQADAALATVRDETSRARALTNDPVWRAVGALPIAGRNARAVSTTTNVVDQVAQNVLPTLVAQAGALDPAAIRVSGSRLDLARIAAAAPALSRARVQAEAAAVRLRGIETANLPSSLRSPIGAVQDEVDNLAALTTNAADAARLMPSMLGADRPRKYLLAFQTNAEARATGGLVGAYAVLEADRGKLRIVTMGPRSKLDKGNLDAPALDLGVDYRRLYGTDPGWWVNTNLSPHFPYAAQLWLAMYAGQGGGKLDGAIATDPVALGYLLGATGPAALADGTKVTKRNAASLTMSEVYRKIPNDDARRDAYLQEVARAVLTNLLAGKGAAKDVAKSLGHAAGDGRLLVYSADPREQAVLATTALGGVTSRSPGPRVGVFANNGSGSKLDYYLHESVDYTLGACTGTNARASTVTITLTNTAPASGLPPYVTTRLDRRGVSAATGARAVAGTNLDLMAVHLPVGAVVTASRRNGAPLDLSPQVELGRPVVTFPVELAPGEKKVVVLDLSEPRSSDAPQVDVQPLAQPVRATVSGASCR